MANVFRVYLSRLRMWFGLQRLNFRLLRRGHFLLYPIRLIGATEDLARLRWPRDVAFQPNVTISLAVETRSSLTVGERCFFGDGCFISVYEDVTFGSDVLVGANCYITSAIHVMSDTSVPIAQQGFAGKPVRVGDGAWIGTGAVVLPGVSIGTGAVVGAGSVVTKDVPANQVWAGVPARKVRDRKAAEAAPPIGQLVLSTIN